MLEQLIHRILRDGKISNFLWKKFKFCFQLVSRTTLMMLATFSSCSPEEEFIEEMEEIMEEKPEGDEDTAPIRPPWFVFLST